jgi:hypothetical protein
VSVASLATTTAYVYSVSNSQDTYGALVETYTLLYSNIPVRIRYMQGRESMTDYKIQNVPRYRIYFPKQYSITESCMIIDAHKSRKYDVIYVNKMDRKRHMQVDTNYVDTILGDFCPNVIHQITASILVTPVPILPFDSYQTVELNGTTTKDHFIKLCNGPTTGYTASDKTFFGDTTANPTTDDDWMSLIVNGITYWFQVRQGTATTDCCTDINGTRMAGT